MTQQLTQSLYPTPSIAPPLDSQSLEGYPDSVLPKCQFPDNYQYPLDFNKTTGKSAGLVGGLINSRLYSHLPEEYNRRLYEEYARKEKQICRCIAITICAITTIAAVALTIAACAVTVMPLLYVAIPLFAIGIGGCIWYLATKTLNPDSAADRAKMRRELSDLSCSHIRSFDLIMKKYPIADIVGYELLEAIPCDYTQHLALYTNDATPADVKLELYTNVVKLAEVYNEQVQYFYNLDRRKVVEIHSRGAAEIRKWHTRAIVEIRDAVLPAATVLDSATRALAVATINHRFWSAMDFLDRWIIRERNILDSANELALNAIQQRYKAILKGQYF